MKLIKENKKLIYKDNTFLMAIIFMAVGGMFAAFGIGDLLGYFKSDDGGPLIMIIFGGIFFVVGFFLIRSREVVFDGKSKKVVIQDKAAFHIFKSAKSHDKYNYEDIDVITLSRKHSNSSNGSSTTFGIRMILENADQINISSYYSNTSKRKRLEIIDALNSHLKQLKAVQ